MNPPPLSSKSSPRELRKAMLRMRLEMHRQELRHETLVMLQPLHKAQDFGRHWRTELKNSNAPLWITGGAFLMALVGLRGGHWRRWLRIALIAFPVLRKRPARADRGK